MKKEVTELAAALAKSSQAERKRHLLQILDRLSIAERFELLHKLAIYHHPESISGAASVLEETAELRRALPTLIGEYGIESMLDVPCGDFHWIQHVALPIDYIGADIVPEIVERNQEMYVKNGRRFEVLDATADALPTVDLVLCRDLLIHLSLRDCWAALSRFAESRSRLLLINHFTDRAENPEIVSGDFRPINLERPPFNFPAPLRIISEGSNLGGGSFRDRAMALWRLSDLADRLRQNRSSS